MKPTVPVLLVFLLCLLAAGNLCAATATVTKVADTNDGACDADCSLREAVVAAVSGDTVVFSPLFNSPQTITLTLGHIIINKNLTINGTGQNLVTVSGSNAGRIFYVNVGGVTVNISGMTFRDGNVGSLGDFDAYGGAIYVDNSRLNVSNATFINNTAFNAQLNGGAGGAIYGFQHSTLTLSNLVVIGNSSMQGSVISSGYSIDIRDSQVKQNSGGGLNSGATMNAERCVVSDNNGGGVGAQYLTITDSAISNNTNGGVSSGDAVSTLTIERCLISGNSRNPTGGGVRSSGTTIIKDTRILNNSATSAGGGISNGGTLYLLNSVVSGNTSSFSGLNDGGAGIRNSVGRLFVINSTISGNTVTSGNPGVGGGIYNLSSFQNRYPIYLINSTIANNTSSGGGGGININPNGDGTFSNTIVAGNNSTGTAQEDVSGIIISNGINLIGNTFGSSGWIASDLLNVNAMLGPLADNGGETLTHALLPSSPAINAGNNSVAIDPQTQMPLTSDQRGFLRIYGGSVDIGAYESQPEITGTVVYGNAAGAPTPRFVSGVLLSAIGSPSVSATSRSDGTYTLGGFGSGSYTVTPSKTGGANGISAFDSALIARHAAGVAPLTGNQLIVADVSGNGTISAFDAGQVARYRVGLSGFGSSGNWIFIPSNRFYSSINSSIAGEDFIALLMGDVSGNWTGNK